MGAFEDAINLIRHAVYGEEVREGIASALELSMNTQQSVAGKEDSSNKVTTVNSNSTDIEYPSAKAVYDSLDNKESKSNKIETSINSSSASTTRYPSEMAVVAYVSSSILQMANGKLSFDYQTTSISYNATNYKKVFTNAAIDTNIKGIVFTLPNSLDQVALCSDGTIRTRSPENNSYGSWEIVSEKVSNKVTTVNSNSTDIGYPSAKAVYDFVRTISQSNIKYNASTTTYDPSTREGVNTIYTRVAIESGVTGVTILGNSGTEFALCSDGTIRYRTTTGSSSYTGWINLIQKATSIGENNKTSGAYPTVQAVYNFVTAFVASLTASLRFVTPEMYTEGTDAEKITAAINSGLPVLLTGTYNVGDFTVSRSCRIFGRKPDNSKNVYNLIGNITFTKPAVLNDLTISGSVTFDKVIDDNVSTQMASTIVTNVSVRGNSDAYPTHNGFVIKSSEGRYINCVASNALHGFSVENIANRLVNCTSYFNMLDGFHVNQGTNMLLACKAFLNSRYNKYWLTHGEYKYTESNPRTSYYGYYLGRKDIQCVGCSSQQNHRGSVYIGTDALVTDINIMGDNTDYYDQDITIRNDSTDSAAFTFGPGIQGEKLAPRISGKVSLYRESRDGHDWNAYTPIVFKKLGSKSNIYIDANIFVPELAPDFNSEVSPTVLGDGMTGIENIVINGDALFNSLHGFSISSPSTNALYSYDGNVLRTSNKDLVRNFTSTDLMACKQVTVAVDFRSDLESSYCNVGVMLSDGTRMSGIYQDNTNQYSDVHTFVAPEGKTITGITIQGARHPVAVNWDKFWDYYRIKVSFKA